MSSKNDLKYVPGLDSLRATACLSVLFFHSNLVTTIAASSNIPFKGGFMGVDLFFVLSGFLITSILVNQYQRYATISFKSFYIKRILRLYPPILIAVIVFLIPLLFTAKADAISNIVSLMTYTGDCAMVVQHFTHLPYPLLSGHSWSLAIEEQFYLTFPFLLFLALRYYSDKKKGNLISFFPLFLALYFMIVIGSTIALGKWFYKFFFWRFFEIYLGCFLAIIYSEAYRKISKETTLSRGVRKIVYKIYSNKIVLAVSTLITMLLLIYPTWLPLYDYIAKYNLHYVLFTITGSVMIVNLAQNYHPAFSKVLSNKVLVSIGKVSYGLYLYAPFINEKINSAFYGGNAPRDTKSMIVADILTLSISLLFSYLSFYLIEKNILKLKSRFGPERESPTLTPNAAPVVL
jgi:peptidoglycan/LPS O-acetylase OafA/YrhL